MCYDISFTVNIKELLDYFPELHMSPQLDLGFTGDHVQGSALFPQYPVIFRSMDGALQLTPMSWGIIRENVKVLPDFKDPGYIMFANKNLNARSERILDDPTSYWYKIRNNRCLIPVSGTIEHRDVGWPNKVPYHIAPKGQKIFFLPALYTMPELVNKKTGEIISFPTWALITRDANEVMRMIHNSGDNPFRMPLYVPQAMAEEWISPNLSPERYREILAYEMPSEDLEYYTLFSVRTSKPHPNGLRKHEPYEWAGLPPLGDMAKPKEKGRKKKEAGESKNDTPSLF
jgi:putative SOS response-associated peptidase YedK